MWEVHYSLEASTYLEDNGQLIADLFFAMESLAGTEGIPTLGGVQAVEEYTYWSILKHLVHFRRIESTQVIYVVFIKPL